MSTSPTVSTPRCDQKTGIGAISKRMDLVCYTGIGQTILPSKCTRNWLFKGHHYTHECQQNYFRSSRERPIQRWCTGRSSSKKNPYSQVRLTKNGFVESLCRMSSYETLSFSCDINTRSAPLPNNCAPKPKEVK